MEDYWIMSHIDGNDDGLSWEYIKSFDDDCCCILSCGGKENIPQSPEVVNILSDVVNNRLQDPEKALSVTFPLSWIKSHPHFTFPQPKETISPGTLKQQFNIVEDWFATNWSGICSQLSKISIPTLVITGEDVAVPPANSLIIAAKIPGSWLVQIKGAGHGLMYQYPEKLSKVLQTFLTTTTIIPSSWTQSKMVR